MQFFRARFYDPSLGRFVSADSVIPEASQGTQAWDRYAGMNNNPVRWNDPSGHCIDPSMCGDNPLSNSPAYVSPPPVDGPVKGIQVQIGITVAMPFEANTGPDKPPFPLLTYNLNFVFDDSGGFQIFQTTRDAYFEKSDFGTVYRPGPAELASPSQLLPASGSVAVGIIGGSEFETTEDYEGLSRDTQLGILAYGVDFYEGYDSKTGEFDGTRFWGFDVGLSAGAPITEGRIAFNSQPLTPRIQFPLLNPWGKR